MRYWMIMTNKIYLKCRIKDGANYDNKYGLNNSSIAKNTWDKVYKLKLFEVCFIYNILSTGEVDLFKAFFIYKIWYKLCKES